MLLVVTFVRNVHTWRLPLNGCCSGGDRVDMYCQLVDAANKLYPGYDWQPVEIDPGELMLGPMVLHNFLANFLPLYLLYIQLYLLSRP